MGLKVCGSGLCDDFQNQRSVYRCLLPGFQFGKSLHIVVKAFTDLADGLFLVEFAVHRFN